MCAEVDQPDLAGQTPLSLMDVEERRLWCDGYQTKPSGQRSINETLWHRTDAVAAGYKKRWLRCRRYALRTALGAFQLSRAA